MELKDKIHYWKRLSDYDLKTAQGVFEKKYYPYTLFFLHLSIEKILKSIYLAQLKLDPPRIHNLTYLAQKCNLKLTDNYWNLFAELNEFNIESRYPEYKQGLYKIANKKYTFKYIVQTKELHKWLKKKLLALLKTI